MRLRTALLTAFLGVFLLAGCGDANGGGGGGAGAGGGGASTTTTRTNGGTVMLP